MYLQKIYTYLFDLNLIAVIAFIGLVIATQRMLAQRLNKKKMPDTNDGYWILLSLKNKPKINAFKTFLEIALFGPAREELIFRAPLLIMFNALNDKYTSLTILVSSLVFGMMHFQSPLMLSKQKIEKKRKIKVVVTFFIGLILSTVSIYYQSIIIPLIIHSCINLLGALIYSYIVFIMGKMIKNLTHDNILEISRSEYKEGELEKAIKKFEQENLISAQANQETGVNSYNSI